MKRNVWTAMAIACAVTVAVAAQSGTTTTTNKKTDDTVTVTGCLQDNSRSGSTTSGSYILANATMRHDATSTSTTANPAAGTATGTTGTTGTTTAGTTMSSGQGTSYLLAGRDDELKKHVGHRIEVTGTVDATDTMRSSTATSTTTSGSRSTTMNSGAQLLKVSSVRMIASDCPAK